MAGRNKTPLLGWHPASAEDSAWIRAEAAKLGRGGLARMLDEALAAYRAAVEASPAPPPKNASTAARPAAPSSPGIRCA
jgi:hypothetical protein